MKHCSECLEECDYFADDVAELCEHCVDEKEGLRCTVYTIQNQSNGNSA